MELPDLAMTIGFLVIPPILFFGIVRSRLRAFVYSVVLGWLLMIAGSQFHLAYTPNYDSFAPAVSIFAGWIPASIYAAIWLAIASIASPSKQSTTDERIKPTEINKPKSR